MLRTLSIFVVLCLFASLVSAAISGDQVTNLPGYGAPPATMYSGLIPADDAQTVFLHYVYIQSTKANPKTAPLLLWLNGGPGCSSLEGFLFENGALHFNGTTAPGNVPMLVDNPYTWSQVANMIYLESPAGVGFSYTVNGTFDTNDDITSQNNYGFLLNFFKGFPELSTLDFYITGESYAGIYIPQLANRIYLGNQAGNAKINLKGIAVGNGCWGNGVGACAFTQNDPTFIALDFFHGHAWVAEPDWAAAVAACGNISNPNPSEKCIDAANDALNAVNDAPFNIYNIYNDCPNMAPRAPNGWKHRLDLHLAKKGKKHMIKEIQSKKVGTPDVCTSPQLASTWLENADVQNALHVAQANVTSWSVCADINYDRSTDSVLGLYPNLIANYKVLIFSGETDACVPYNGSEEWVRNLGYPVSQAWQPWLTNNQVSGYQVQYKAGVGFRFLTVKDSGHMVPQYQPEPALNMISGWLDGSL